MKCCNMRGQSNILLAAIFVAVFVLLLVPLTLYIYYSSLSTPPLISLESRVLNTKVTRGEIVAVYDEYSQTILVLNNSGSDLDVEDLVVQFTCSETTSLISLGKTGLEKTKIFSGSSLLINLYQALSNACSNPQVNTIYIITREGIVIAARIVYPSELSTELPPGSPSTPQPITSAVIMVPVGVNPGDNITTIQYLLLKGFEIYTLDNMYQPTMLQPYDNLDRGMSGGVGGRYIWRLDKVYENTSIKIDNQVVRNIWLGYDPKNTSNYNIIITADKITIATPSYSKNTYVRVKIFGFKPLTQQGILALSNTWVTRPSEDIANYTFLTTSSTTTRLTLNGTAERVEIYVRSAGEESGYDPYIFFMNTNGVAQSAGIFFTTIDRIWGFSDSRNEGIDVLLDYSRSPLALVYSSFSISNSEYSAVVISVNYRFHDNEGNDAEGTSVDRPIFFVGLVDENSFIYSYRSFNFRELTRYEDTYPPTAQAQSTLIFIPLPDPSSGVKIFYVFIAIQDPYSYNTGNYLDDIDFTLFIESLVIIPVKG